MDDRMNDWVNMGGGMDEWMGGWVDGWVDLSVLTLTAPPLELETQGSAMG